jgi:hypothetical protein
MCPLSWQTEGFLDWITNWCPARLSPGSYQVCIERMIDAYRELLTADRRKATEEESALAKRLLERLDRAQRHHFGEPDV